MQVHHHAGLRPQPHHWCEHILRVDREPAPGAQYVKHQSTKEVECEHDDAKYQQTGRGSGDDGASSDGNGEEGGGELVHERYLTVGCISMVQIKMNLLTKKDIFDSPYSKSKIQF